LGESLELTWVDTGDDDAFVRLFPLWRAGGIVEECGLSCPLVYGLLMRSDAIFAGGIGPLSYGLER
jgi:hypothetical protein